MSRMIRARATAGPRNNHDELGAVGHRAASFEVHAGVHLVDLPPANATTDSGRTSGSFPIPARVSVWATAMHDET